MNDLKQTRQELWQQFEIDVDIYKFYLNLTVKIAGLVLALTGAILAYVLAHYQADGIVLAALVLPLILSLALLWLHIRGVSRAGIFLRKHEQLSKKLGMTEPYDFSFLQRLQRLLAILYGIVALGLIACLYWLMMRVQPERLAHLWPG